MTQLHTIAFKHVESLRVIPNETFEVYLPRLHALVIDGCGLQHVPFLDKLRVGAANGIIEMIELMRNRIRNIPSNALRVAVNQLKLEYNLIESVEEGAFNGSQIGTLSLKGNRDLVHIHERAFAGLVSLRELDLSETGITRLPTVDLQRVTLRQLRVQRTHSLKTFPPVYDFVYLEVASLTYPYHCCAFKHPDTHNPKAHSEYVKRIMEMRREICSEPCDAEQTTEHLAPVTRTMSDDTKELSSGFGRSPPKWGSLVETGSFGVPKKLSKVVTTGAWAPRVSIGNNATTVICCGTLVPNFQKVNCGPAPDAFNPCEDVMGNNGLRVAVWFVVVAAVIGNMAVMVVLMSSRFKMTVSKYLMCNLAFADFCMGVYLLIVAAEDANTIGEYFNHAINWQEGAGCQVAGFLTVFASELSIFTLTVITLERWYAITYAIHLNKRLKLGMAAKVMVLGWIYAVALAALPLFGVSNYTMTSICLPFGASDTAAMAYLVTLLTINGLAFLLICACYAKMYSSISGHNSTVTQSDKTVAKRMALLVFTDFACWAPIAFFGLTAVAGYPLINVTDSKILLVCFYPLNSCANPFLYAIFTKQYRKDLYVLLGRYGFCIRRSNYYLHPGSNTNTVPRNATNSTSVVSESGSNRGSFVRAYFANGRKRGSLGPATKGNATERPDSLDLQAPVEGPNRKEISLYLEGEALCSVAEESCEVFTSEEDLAGLNPSPATRRGSSPNSAKGIYASQGMSLRPESIFDLVMRGAYDKGPQVPSKTEEDCADSLLNGFST